MYGWPRRGAADHRGVLWREDWQARRGLRRRGCGQGHI